MNYELLKKKANEKGITEIELYSSKSGRNDIQLFNGVTEKNVTSISDVCCVRGVYNGKIATIYTENPSDDSIDFVLNNIISNTKLITKDDPFIMYGGDESYPVIVEKETDFENLSGLDKVNLCKKLEELARARSEYVMQVQTSYTEVDYEVSITNTNGLDVSRNGKQAVLVLYVICGKDGEVKTTYDIAHIFKMADLNLEEFVNKVVDETVSQFGGEPVPSGTYDIVLSNEVVCSLLSAYSSVFCATNVIKKMSFLENKINEQVFGKNINIVDDPTCELSDSRDSFDDEGVATSRKMLVENGVLKTYLHNLSTAMMMDTKSTGNGFKAGAASSVEVQASNLHITAGELSQEDLFKKLNNGLYITSLSGLHAGVNPISGNYSLQASGYEIKDGKVANPVTLIIVSSSIQDTLNNVVEIGNDFKFVHGYGAPSLLVKGISISGK